MQPPMRIHYLARGCLRGIAIDLKIDIAGAQDIAVHVDHLAVDRHLRVWPHGCEAPVFKTDGLPVTKGHAVKDVAAIAKDTPVLGYRVSSLT